MNGFLVVAGWLVAVVAQILLLPVVVALVVLAGLGYTVAIALRQAWQVLTVPSLAGPSDVANPPKSAPGPVLGVPAPRSPEPAYRSYFLQQAWLDLWVVTRRSAVAAYQRAREVYARLWRALSQRHPIAAFIWPSLVALVLGTALLAVPIAVGLAGLAVAQALVIAVGALGWLVVVGALSLVEYVLRSLRRIVVACPHPGCYRRFGLPTYVCSTPGCGERHRRLVPNQYGALRHTCRCGARLPTLVLLGRHRLAAQCPHCSMPLPGRIGRVRVEHLPIVGGPDAGKSTFLCLSVAALRSQLALRGGSSSFIDARDERAMADGLTQLRRGDRLIKTGVVLPRAVMLDVRPPGQDGRILYAFDPAGEYYAGRAIDSQRYLDNTDVALVVVDPLAIPGVWQTFTEADRQIIAAAAPANQAGAVRENAGDVVDRLVSALHGRPGGARLRRILVVVTKSDVIRRTTIGARLSNAGAGGAGVAVWLEQVGWGNWIRALAACTTELAFLASALDLPETDFAAPVAWLTGIDLHQQPSRKPATPIQSREVWVSSGRPGQLPPGHRIGRIAVLGVVVASMAALGVGTLLYALHTIAGIYG